MSVIRRKDPTFWIPDEERWICWREKERERERQRHNVVCVFARQMRQRRLFLLNDIAMIPRADMAWAWSSVQCVCENCTTIFYYDVAEWQYYWQYYTIRRERRDGPCCSSLEPVLSQIETKKEHSLSVERVQERAFIDMKILWFF
jgi:hypothetical protein